MRKSLHSLLPIVGFSSLLFALAPTHSYAQNACAQNGNVDPGPPSYQICSGFFGFEPASTSITFQMSGEVACQWHGYYGAQFSNNQSVTADGQCGSSPEGAAPECYGHIGPPIFIGGSSYQWVVETSASWWTNPDCGYQSPPGTTQIGVGVEGCCGSTCSGPNAAEACVHQGGLFDGCVCGFSPIIISLDGPELRLTDARRGVHFDMLPDGVPDRTSWTRANAADAFLVLDRNRNGRIDSGKELFGSTTDQPPTDDRNGFNALVPFDMNKDRRIDDQDPIYSRLRLWTDRNHNGVSDSDELQTLRAGGVVSLSLDYRDTRRRDQHGNQFRYAALVKIRDGRNIVSYPVYDVFLVGK
jgi:hypothetical protein